MVLAGLLLAAPSPVAAEPEAAGPVSITYAFRRIRQGSVGIVRVTGTDIAAVLRDLGFVVDLVIDASLSDMGRQLYRWAIA